MERNVKVLSVSSDLAGQGTQSETELSILADLLERAKAGKLGPADFDLLYEMELRVCGDART